MTFDVTANDALPGTKTIQRTAGTRWGSLTCTTAGVCTYQSLPGYAGVDSFRYQVSTPTTGPFDVPVTITVLYVNDAPIVRDDRAVTGIGAPVTVPVLANDEDPNAAGSSTEPAGPNRPGDTLALTTTGARTVTPAAAGTATCASAGTCTFTPAAGYTGPASFTYGATDSGVSDARVADPGVPGGYSAVSPLTRTATVAVRVDPAALTPSGFTDAEARTPSVATGTFAATGATPTATASCAAGRARITVSWAGTAGATTYRLERRVVGDAGFELVGSGITSTSYLDDLLGEAVAIQYRVRPEQQRWLGTASAASTAATVAKPTTAPGGC